MSKLIEKKEKTEQDLKVIQDRIGFNRQKLQQVANELNSEFADLIRQQDEAIGKIKQLDELIEEEKTVEEKKEE